MISKKEAEESIARFKELKEDYVSMFAYGDPEISFDTYVILRSLVLVNKTLSEKIDEK